jgi:putative ABC transport system permease protein
MEDLVGASTTQPRFRTLLVATFAGVAVLLAVVGVAGVIAFTVSRRTQEIGVRVALGATRRQVVSLLVRQGLAPTAIGMLAGLAGAMALGRVLSGLLFGVAASDPTVFAGAAGLLAVAAVVAAYVPARRAASASPLDALRAE